PLPLNVVLSESGGNLADYFQDFTFGSYLSFQVSLSFDSPNPTSFPDDVTFGLALYDGSFNPLLSNGNGGDFIFTIDLHPDGTTTFNDFSTGGEVTLTPEPATAALLVIALALMIGFRQFRRRIFAGAAAVLISCG